METSKSRLADKLGLFRTIAPHLMGEYILGIYKKTDGWIVSDNFNQPPSPSAFESEKRYPLDKRVLNSIFYFFVKKGNLYDTFDNFWAYEQGPVEEDCNMWMLYNPEKLEGMYCDALSSVARPKSKQLSLDRFTPEVAERTKNTLQRMDNEQLFQLSKWELIELSQDSDAWQLAWLQSGGAKYRIDMQALAAETKLKSYHETASIV